MLAAEALRLAAIEVLCPTEAAIAGSGFPTLAKARVFDSRAAAIEDLDRDAPSGYTPVLSLYTPESGAALRSSMSSADDAVADAMLDIVAELAVADRDEDGEFADAVSVAETDPEARLVLAALCSQVRYLLEQSPSGAIWRHLVNHVIKLELMTFAVPNLGLRFHRVTMRFHCEIRDDDFSSPGLPEPIATIYNALPDESYAKAKLEALADHFVSQAPEPLEGITVHLGLGQPST